MPARARRKSQVRETLTVLLNPECADRGTSTDTSPNEAEVPCESHSLLSS
jgi:hypothetical protein